MAVCVVEILEFVDIHKQKGQRLFIAVRPLCFYFELSVKMPGIVELREVIDYAQFLVFLFALLQRFQCFLTFGDVANIALNYPGVGL